MPDDRDLKLSPEEALQLHSYREAQLFHQAMGVPLQALGMTDNLQAIIQKKGITYWEQLTCAGYNPALRQLEATLVVKRPTGYGGSLCSHGSSEFVRFFIDWGAGFVDVGISSVQVYDIPDAAAGATSHPLSFLVHLSLDDRSHRRICRSPVVPALRAVLSWNVAPRSDPNAPTHFGNVLNTHIQIQPALRFKDVIDLKTVEKFALDIDLEADVPRKKVPPADFKALLEADGRANVPLHRTVFGAFHPLIRPRPHAFVPPYSTNGIEAVKIDWAAILAALNKDKADVHFEQVTCVGLSPSLDTLGAVIRVKRPSGYSGDLCSAGSFEYVAFWADFDNDGTFDEYLGTANVKVHDISPFPDGGIDYSVLWPVDFSKRIRACARPQVIGIRAVLSWATPPSTTDPDDLETWGNRLDVKVLLRKAEKPVTGGLIEQLYDIGSVPLVNIDNSSYLAYASPGSTGAVSNRPWGGLVRVGGRIQGAGAPPSVWFKVEYANHSAGNWKPVTAKETFEMMYPLDFLHPQHHVTVVAVDGWLAYQENAVAFPAIYERTAKLSTWSTIGLPDGAYDLRLAYTTDDPNAGVPTHINYSLTKTIMLCNTPFVLSDATPPLVGLDMSATLDIVITGGDCRKYSKEKNETIQGELRVVHPYFGSWNLDLQPTSHTHGIAPTPPSRAFVSPTDYGETAEVWTLAVGGLDTCGYTLTLWGYDRTIIDSNGALVHWSRKAVGFSVV
jgi:hypothetical protein